MRSRDSDSDRNSLKDGASALGRSGKSRRTLLTGDGAAGRIITGYAMLATMASAIALAVGGRLPLSHPQPWLQWSAPEAMAISVILGVGLALFVVAFTRFSVVRFRWAARLHIELRPMARSLGPGQIAALAVMSSLGEELLFRGLLTPWLGIIGSSVVFGLVHQIRGSSRWIWVAWATAVGLPLAAIFAVTGSLLGPLLAHAIVNAMNLRFLQSYDLESMQGAVDPPSDFAQPG